MENKNDIIDIIGVKQIAAALSVTEDAVRQARRQTKLPAAWFDTLETLAGHALPREWFNFKAATP